MILLIVIGVIGGIIGGMGMGGGTAIIPLTILILGVEQKEAQTISLVAFAVMAAVVIFVHIKNKLVNFKIGIIFIVTGLISASIMALLVQNISGNLLRILFGCFLIAVGIYEFAIIIAAWIKKKRQGS